MSKKDKDNGVSDLMEGLNPVDPKALEDYKREMANNVIPKIVDATEKRRKLAAASRQKHLKC